ncbi:F-box/WD repeat-containing protein 4 [Teleopsis dalmanni]|uniref:F-box/WD repeat-containing protein 4 n=1 Tax=Teleopsis dalmanni TaxID=139649 RepID=UPI0018CCE74E|nr:F-box/WD repeat-containing protein 4 [Teleopsis dalmanni]
MFVKRLTDLNVDCLLNIFRYCSETDLINLCKVSNVLLQIIEENVFYVQSLDLLMCGHRNQPNIQQRTELPLSYFGRITISKNWVEGRYREREYFHHSRMFAKKLHLERNWLYISHSSMIRKHRRKPLEKRYHQEIGSNAKSDIADFVKKQDTIFAGRICGSCFICENDSVTEQRMHTSCEYLYSVDFVNDLYVTSTDQFGKLWRKNNEFSLIHFDLLHIINNSYKVIKLSHDGSALFGGLYTDINRKALREIDVETGKQTTLNSNTISIYDLKLKDDNILFTANFDTTFRMFDRRTNRDEAIWEDPFDSSFYCLEYDGLYSVLCGAKYHSRVNLYDIRVPGKYIQLYFPQRYSRQRACSSPVYSIACDSRYLFIATDHSLRVFDFKTEGIGNTAQDYRNIFSEIQRCN